MLFGSFMIKDAEAIDDYTVKINLKYPYGPFLSMLTYMYIANEKAMTEMGDDAAKHPIGTGAYKFKQWDVAQQIVLEANPDYYKGAPSINTLTFKIIPDSNTAFVALEDVYKRQPKRYASVPQKPKARSAAQAAKRRRAPKQRGQAFRPCKALSHPSYDHTPPYP